MSVNSAERFFASSEFGAITLIGNESHRHAAATGLLGTCSATNMLGRFSKLSLLSHPHLCKYIDLIRSVVLENAVFLISEHYPRSAADELKYIKRPNVARIISLLQSTLSAFTYLHSQLIVIGHFTLNSILLPTEDAIRLAQFGLNYITGGEQDIDYCLHSLWYLPPERILRTAHRDGPVCRAGDIWSLGIATLELSIGHLLSEIWSAKQFHSLLASLVMKKSRGSIYRLLMNEILRKVPDISMVSDRTILTVLEKTLCILPSERPTAKHLLLIMRDGIVDYSNEEKDIVYSSGIFLSDLEENIEEMRESISFEQQEMVQQLPLSEAFFLWKLCGSNVETILINHGVVKINPPILSLPNLVDDDCSMYGNADMRKHESKFDVFILPSNNLRERIKLVDRNKLLISFEMGPQMRENDGLSLIVKEKDIEYQARRMLILRRLLLSYPFKKSQLFTECCHDIPPLYRANLWSALLNIYCDSEQRFVFANTLSSHSSDRQLLVDIPRCHQYDELMTSPTAHRKLKRLLKAWLVLNKNYVYWQGLDSLTAPFLVLNFGNLAKAYCCLESFISLYLHNFFLKDNSSVIQEYLAVFTHLLSFVDAPLFAHLFTIEFHTELFAIPWFLTCFAHILPLHKLFHVWDALLLSDSSFPLFVGLAIMEQLRTRLITTHFNEAILLFSDLPDLNIERLVQCSLNYYNSVPASCTFRQYASKHVREEYNMTHYTVSELNEFCCPRISVVDVSRLVEHSLLLAIDVRSQYEFSRGAIVGSINLPPYGEVDTLDTVKTALVNAQLANHIIVIVDNEHLQRAKKITKLCVLEGFSHVCILDGGVQKIRALHDIFCIPV